MSYADEVFIRNCRDILTHGVWDTDQAVRPRWEDDGAPAHKVRYRQPLRPVQGVPAADAAAYLLENRRGRAAVDLAAEVEQHP